MHGSFKQLLSRRKDDTDRSILAALQQNIPPCTWRIGIGVSAHRRGNNLRCSLHPPPRLSCQKPEIRYTEFLLSGSVNCCQTLLASRQTSCNALWVLLLQVLAPRMDGSVAWHWRYIAQLVCQPLSAKHSDNRSRIDDARILDWRF